MADESESEADDSGKKRKKRTGAELMAIKAFESALDGDWTAWKLIRDTLGEKTSEKPTLSEVDPAVVKEIEDLLYESE